MIGFKIEVTGAAELAANLASLASKVRAKALKEAVKAGVKETVKAVKDAVPKDTGALKKAIGDRTKTYRKGANIIGIVGARVGQKREVVRTFTKRGKQRIKLRRVSGDGSAGEIRDPARYLNLANKGRKAVRSRGRAMPMRLPNGQMAFARGARATQGTHFMEAAFRNSQGAVRSAMLAKLREGVASALADSKARG